MEDSIIIEIAENKLCKIKTQSNAGIETKYVSFKDVVNIFTSANLLENNKKKRGVYKKSDITSIYWYINYTILRK